MLAFTVGANQGWSSPVIPKLSGTDQNPLPSPITEDEESWIGSLLSLGAAFGCFPYAFISNTLGRKASLIAIGVPFVAAFFMMAFAENVAVFYVARILSGLSLGGTFAIVPTYVAEISETSIRGMLSSIMNNLISTGMMVSYCLGPYVSVQVFTLVLTSAPIVFLVTSLFIPESPYYLIGKKRRESAENSLMVLRKTDVYKVQEELEEIQRGVEKDRESSGTFVDIFRTKASRKALLISIVLVLFQQMSGINVLQFYAQTIFETASDTVPDEVYPMIIGAVQLAACFIAPLAVERLGRKKLFLVSAVGMMVSEVPMGLYFYLQDEGNDVKSLVWLPIVALVVYVISFHSGFGPLPWTVMAEIFPENIKAAASSATVFSCYVISFLITRFFKSVSAHVGLGGAFWIFSGFNFAAIFFTHFVVPETKGRTFQEIQKILGS